MVESPSGAVHHHHFPDSGGSENTVLEGEVHWNAPRRLSEKEEGARQVFHSPGTKDFTYTDEDDDCDSDSKLPLLKNNKPNLKVDYSSVTDTDHADDEGGGTTENCRQSRPRSCRMGHRRTRSGDKTAANLMLGKERNDWRGMAMDELPHPEEQGDDDEKEEEEGEHVGQLKLMGGSKSGDSKGRRKRGLVGGGEIGMLGVDGNVPSASAPLEEVSCCESHSTQSSVFSWISGRISVLSNNKKKGQNNNHRPKGRNNNNISFGSKTISERSDYSRSDISQLLMSNDESQGDDSSRSSSASSETCSSSTSASDANPVFFSPLARSPQNKQASTRPPPPVLPVLNNAANNIRTDIEAEATIGMKRSPSKKELRAMYQPKMLSNYDSIKTLNDVSTYKCPRCGRLNREFFTVNNAPKQFESPMGYLALYFGIYVVAALFIFGLEEGWEPLDCVYFSVITLTTAGLGDLHPTTDGAKVVCSIFIYFGVACIGLLLGSLLASSLDDEAGRVAKEQLANNCIHCEGNSQFSPDYIRQERRSFSTRNVRKNSDNNGFLQQQKAKRANYNSERGVFGVEKTNLVEFLRQESQHEGASKFCPSTNQQYGSMSISTNAVTTTTTQEENKVPSVKSKYFGGRRVNHNNTSGYQHDANNTTTAATTDSETNTMHQMEMGGFHPSITTSPDDETLKTPLLSPTLHARLTPATPLDIMNRSSHTRHLSLNTGSSAFSKGIHQRSAPKNFSGRRKYSHDVTMTNNPPDGSNTIDENAVFHMNNNNNGQRNPNKASYYNPYSNNNNNTSNIDDSASSSDGSYYSAYSELLGPVEKFHVFKHVFLTLKQAVMNSILIIAIGSFGFYFIERLNAVDSFYFTTVLLTTVGYGDIVPKTPEGKMFSTVYVLVAGTILLHNMSLISKIPLDLRKIRIERAVLSQFGEHLDDSGLQELASGPLIRRLQVASDRTDGLRECTREMFALAMLVRLGRISERDVRATFEAFRRLDRDNDGMLNTKDIIYGEVAKRKKRRSEVPIQRLEVEEHRAENEEAMGTKRFFGNGGFFAAQDQSRSAAAAAVAQGGSYSPNHSPTHPSLFQDLNVGGGEQPMQVYKGEDIQSPETRRQIATPPVLSPLLPSPPASRHVHGLSSYDFSSISSFPVDNPNSCSTETRARAASSDNYMIHPDRNTPARLRTPSFDAYQQEIISKAASGDNLFSPSLMNHHQERIFTNNNMRRRANTVDGQYPLTTTTTTNDAQDGRILRVTSPPDMPSFQTMNAIGGTGRGVGSTSSQFFSSLRSARDESITADDPHYQGIHF